MSEYRHKQHDLIIPIMSILADEPRGRLRTDILKDRLLNRLKLSAKDRQERWSQPGEMMISQIINNIVSNRASIDAFRREWLYYTADGELGISAKGKTFIQGYGGSRDAMGNPITKSMAVR